MLWVPMHDAICGKAKNKAKQGKNGVLQIFVVKKIPSPIADKTYTVPPPINETPPGSPGPRKSHLGGGLI